MQILRNLVVTAACLCSLPAFALSDEGRQALAGLQSRWAEINYRLPKDAREAAFETLGQTADRAVKAEPDAPELLIWHGIILTPGPARRAGWRAQSRQGGRANFEAALAFDPRALDGSAYTSRLPVLPGPGLADRVRRRQAGRGDVAEGLEINRPHRAELFLRGLLYTRSAMLKPARRCCARRRHRTDPAGRSPTRGVAAKSARAGQGGTELHCRTGGSPNKDAKEIAGCEYCWWRTTKARQGDPHVVETEGLHGRLGARRRERAACADA